MKKFLLTIVLLLGIAAQAQQIDFGNYQSLLREDRVWVNFYDQYLPEDLEGNPRSFTITYTYELRGDSILNGTQYKKCYMKTSGKLPIHVTENVQKLKEIDHPVALLREENMLVYCRLNDYPEDLLPDFYEGQADYLLYDFATARMQVLLGQAVFEKVNLDGNFFNQYKSGQSTFIETIGGCSSFSVLLFTDWPIATKEFHNESSLSHVMNKDGNIIYKTPEFREPTPSGIVDIHKECVTDDNYYNLQGQAVDIKSAPAGIYIHNGKKVVVK